jgi:transposase
MESTLEVLTTRRGRREQQRHWPDEVKALIVSPEARLAGRQQRAAPLVADMHAWLVQHHARIATKSPLVEALAYIAKYWDGLKLFLTDGRIEIDNNSVEWTIRPIALNRKNALFAGHDAGAENWATIASLIETCKLNAVDPQAYLTTTLTAIAKGYRQSRIDELLPWNYPASV